ncbi:MAG: hypothetical protein ACM31C_31875 [Acidobacteriota bacterium]
MRWWLAIVVVGGCRFDHGIAPPAPDSPAIDAPATGSGDAPGATAFCFGKDLNLCLSAMPSGAITLPGANPLDTDTDANCTEVVAQTNGPAVCVIAGATITVNADMTATGSRPLALIATDTVTMNATIDVSSTSGGRTGAGASAAPCAVTENGTPDAHGGGGGAGGSFGASGGAGGKGDNNDQNGGTGGVGGSAPLPIAPPPLRAGCAGGNGGNGDGTHPGGAGGASGGAIAIIAGTRIQIGASVYASGAGGGAGTGNNSTLDVQCGGGGGGGSGGMIALDAPTIQVGGVLAANGGGGGGGGGDNGTGTGGSDGSTVLYSSIANGGGGGGMGPDQTGGGGGNGAAGAVAANAGGSVKAGGGGGGGGLGVIWVHGTLSAANLSPSPTAH